MANGGRFSPTSITVRPEPAGVQAIDPRAAYIVSDILSDTNARARTFGTDSVLATRFWTAVKTGTSKDMRDNWAIGYSQRYSVGVWVGNASGAPMWDVSGTTGAAPIWAAVMQFLHKNQSSQAPRIPAVGLVKIQVKFSPDDLNLQSQSQSLAQAPLEATRQEWFLVGTEQTMFSTQGGSKNTINNIANNRINTATIVKNSYKNGKNSQNELVLASSETGSARILTPTSGNIIALDPDIPPNRQRVNFEAEGANLAWLIDGKPFAKGANAKWLPWPGRHVVQLVDAKGMKLDEIRLEVRGAGVRR